MSDLRLIVGGRIEDDTAAFSNAWRRSEAGDRVCDRTVSFESWELFISVMSGERLHLLKHIHAHPEPSVSALARSLGRQYRRVQADVAALMAAGLIDRRDGALHAVADTITADLRL